MIMLWWILILWWFLILKLWQQICLMHQVRCTHIIKHQLRARVGFGINGALIGSSWEPNSLHPNLRLGSLDFWWRHFPDWCEELFIAVIGVDGRLLWIELGVPIVLIKRSSADDADVRLPFVVKDGRLIYCTSIERRRIQGHRRAGWRNHWRSVQFVVSSSSLIWYHHHFIHSVGLVDCVKFRFCLWSLPGLYLVFLKVECKIIRSMKLIILVCSGFLLSTIQRC